MTDIKILLITVLALSAAAIADPAVILSNGFLASPLTSAALVAPPASPVVGPISPIATYSPLASYAISPLSSDYRYGYSSSYNYQDYYPVNSALTLPYSPPYAYAADWFYRK